MKIVPVLMISLTMVAYSCDKKENANTTISTEAVETTAPSDSSVIMTDSVTAVQPNEARQAPVAATANNVQAANTGGKPALNPPHGEPFHRCDIAVGAPIDSAPQQAAPAPVVPQAAPQSGFNTSPINPVAAPAPVPAAAQNNTGPKPALNPAHGEPWHRCDLQVGAPLT